MLSEAINWIVGGVSLQLAEHDANTGAVCADLLGCCSSYLADGLKHVLAFKKLLQTPGAWPLLTCRCCCRKTMRIKRCNTGNDVYLVISQFLKLVGQYFSMLEML